MEMEKERSRTSRPPEERNDLIPGRNAVIEALKAGRTIENIQIVSRREVAPGASTGSMGKIIAMAKERGIPVKEVNSQKLAELCPGVSHQGVVAVCSAHEYSDIPAMFRLAEERGEPPFLVIADELEDAHNLGAILRTGEACGVHGVIIPKRRSVGLTYAVCKTSAGAVEYLPVARVTNLVQTIEQLKKQGVWVFAADMGGSPWCQTDFTGPVAIVVGSEGAGVGRLVKERCDGVVSLPMRGKINSLNASVAASAIMLEVSRQRLQIKTSY